MLIKHPYSFLYRNTHVQLNPIFGRKIISTLNYIKDIIIKNINFRLFFK